MAPSDPDRGVDALTMAARNILIWAGNGWLKAADPRDQDALNEILGDLEVATDEVTAPSPRRTG